TANVIRFDWHALVSDRLGNGHFPTYFAFLKVLGLASASDVALRLPSAVAGALAGGVMTVLVLRLSGPLTAAIFAILFAINPFVIYYDIEARPYAAMALFLSIALVGYAGLFRAGTRLWAAIGLIAIGSIVAGLLVPAGIVSVAVQQVAILACGVRRFPRRIRLALAGQAAVTWAIFVTASLQLTPGNGQQPRHLADLADTDKVRTMIERCVIALVQMFGFIVPSDVNRYLPAYFEVGLAVVFVGLAIAGMIRTRRQPVFRFLSFVLVGTPVVFIAMGVVSPTAARYMTGTVPLAILFAATAIACGFSVPRWRFAVAALAAAFVLGTLLQLRDGTESEVKLDWRPAAAFLADRDLRNVELYSPHNEFQSILTHYLPDGTGVRYRLVDYEFLPVSEFWKAVGERDDTWAVVHYWLRPPEDLAAHRIVCTEQFGRVSVLYLTRDAATIPPGFESCKAGADLGTRASVPPQAPTATGPAVAAP
ncbi:MAG: hypothetical protein J0H54_08170, partial [Rhizobiales bacterium]|nr:hypothetical protein [Hyphomicrobiales bacterium]